MSRKGRKWANLDGALKRTRFARHEHKHGERHKVGKVDHRTYPTSRYDPSPADAERIAEQKRRRAERKQKNSRRRR